MNGVSVKARNIAARKAGLQVLRKGNAHYTEVAKNLQKMADLQEMHSQAGDEGYEGLSKSDIRDQFAMCSNLVDKHWRIVEKLLPKDPSIANDTDADEGAVPPVHQLIERLVGERVQGSDAVPLQDRSVVPAPVRPEKE